MESEGLGCTLMASFLLIILNSLGGLLMIYEYLWRNVGGGVFEFVASQKMNSLSSSLLENFSQNYGLDEPTALVLSLRWASSKDEVMTWWIETLSRVKRGTGNIKRNWHGCWFKIIYDNLIENDYFLILLFCTISIRQQKRNTWTQCTFLKKHIKTHFLNDDNWW